MSESMMTIDPKVSGTDDGPESIAAGGAEISMRGVTKTYASRSGEDVMGLSPVDLDIAPGEFFSLVGPSGCGKSTLLNMIAGLLPVTAGSLTVGGESVTTPRPGTGAVFQKPTLLRWLTVEENVRLPLKIANKLNDRTRAEADDLLCMAGLADFRRSYPHELSGGMQQRASIVRALASGPSLLLMDEPFSALDEFRRDQLNDELLRLWTARPMTVVFITHNIAEAVYLSDRVGIMSSHPGVLTGSVDIALDRPRDASVRRAEEFYRYVVDIRSQFEQRSASAEQDTDGGRL